MQGCTPGSTWQSHDQEKKAWVKITIQPLLAGQSPWRECWCVCSRSWRHCTHLSLLHWPGQEIKFLKVLWRWSSPVLVVSILIELRFMCLIPTFPIFTQTTQQSLLQHQCSSGQLVSHCKIDKVNTSFPLQIRTNILLLSIPALHCKSGQIFSYYQYLLAALVEFSLPIGFAHCICPWLWIFLNYKYRLWMLWIIDDVSWIGRLTQGGHNPHWQLWGWSRGCP